MTSAKTIFNVVTERTDLRGNLLFHYSDRPKVRRQIVVGQIRIGNGEIAAYSPVRSPRVAANEPPLSVIIAHRADGMTAQDSLARVRHRGMASSGDFDCFEAFIDGKSEYERIARGKATLHLRQTLDQALIDYGSVFGCLRVASRPRARPKLGNYVRPHRFGTGSLVRDRFNSIPDHRTTVGIGCTFENAFVVINEEA